MNWTDAPIGMKRHDELLAILESLAFTLHRANRGGNYGCAAGREYVAGFSDALTAVAMSAGLADYFKPAPPIVVELPKRIESGGEK